MTQFNHDAIQSLEQLILQSEIKKNVKIFLACNRCKSINLLLCHGVNLL